MVSLASDWTYVWGDRISIRFNDAPLDWVQFEDSRTCGGYYGLVGENMDSVARRSRKRFPLRSNFTFTTHLKQFGLKQSKYKNKPVEADGKRFDSIKECNRYWELKALYDKGTIKNLTLQPVFKFPTGFSYWGDFMYRYNGKVVVEDVKGYETDVFKLKKKCMGYFYPDIELRIIH